MSNILSRCSSVALGLLKHLKDYRNQIAARLTVLEPATLIAKEVISK
jgi:hypothetical protein